MPLFFECVDYIDISFFCGQKAAIMKKWTAKKPAVSGLLIGFPGIRVNPIQMLSSFGLISSFIS